MARRSCTFRQRDVEAAVKAVRTAGCDVARVEIGKDGRITIVTSQPQVASEQDTGGNEWDRV